MEPTLAVKDSWTPVFSQGGEPSRVFIAHPRWWEGKEATVDRSGIHRGLHSCLHSCRKHLSSQRASIESTQTMCCRAAAAWWGSIRLDWECRDAQGVQEVLSKCKGIPCTSGGDVIRSAFPLTLAEHREYLWKNISLETPSQGI